MVSIILPNLNTPLEYLKERVLSITNQTYVDWECIIVDGYSDNGSWEYLKEVARTEPRFQAYQFKKEGIYKAWNSGLEMARGEYVYIAPSDDTMTPDFFQKMVMALEAHPECGIAHCCLTIIDNEGKPSTSRNWDKYYPSQYFKELMHKKHIRMAPHDGILHCGIKTVYTSLTQLLIRKSVFDKVGLFLTDQGSIADFEWGMRASLVFNTLHIPEYLATWRNYEGQATSDSIQKKPRTYETLRGFIRHAFTINRSNKLLEQGEFDIRELQSLYWQTELDLKLNTAGGLFNRMIVLGSFLFKKPALAMNDLISRINGTKELSEVARTRQLMQKHNLGGHIRLIDCNNNQ